MIYWEPNSLSKANFPKANQHTEGDTMSKTYTCRDVGVDCDWNTSGETKDEVMAKIQAHAAQVHPTIELTPELVEKVRDAIKDE